MQKCASKNTIILTVVFFLFSIPHWAFFRRYCCLSSIKYEWCFFFFEKLFFRCWICFFFSFVHQNVSNFFRFVVHHCFWISILAFDVLSSEKIRQVKLIAKQISDNSDVSVSRRERKKEIERRTETIEKIVGCFFPRICSIWCMLLFHLRYRCRLLSLHSHP